MPDIGPNHEAGIECGTRQRLREVRGAGQGFARLGVNELNAGQQAATSDRPDIGKVTQRAEPFVHRAAHCRATFDELVLRQVANGRRARGARDGVMREGLRVIQAA